MRSRTSATGVIDPRYLQDSTAYFAGIVDESLRDQPVTTIEHGDRITIVF
jgi:hypothetical protein